MTCPNDTDLGRSWSRKSVLLETIRCTWMQIVAPGLILCAVSIYAPPLLKLRIFPLKYVSLLKYDHLTIASQSCRTSALLSAMFAGWFKFTILILTHMMKIIRNWPHCLPILQLMCRFEMSSGYFLNNSSFNFPSNVLSNLYTVKMLIWWINVNTQILGVSVVTEHIFIPLTVARN